MLRRTLVSVLLAGCGTSAATNPATQSPAAPPSTQAPLTAKPAAGLDAEIVTTATTADKLDKLKVRVDADGKIVKQSLYHYDAAVIPKPVRDLAASTFEGSTAVRYETEWYADVGRIYEVEVDTKDGKHCEVAATPDGKLQYTECRIDPTTLPSEVAKTVHDLAGTQEILEAEKKTRADGEEFTVEIADPGGDLYVRIAADGSLLGKYRRVPGIIEVPVP